MSATPIVHGVAAMWTSSARVCRPAHWQFSTTWKQLASGACNPLAQKVTHHCRTRRDLSTTSSSLSSSSNNTPSPFRLTSHKSSTTSLDSGASASAPASSPTPSPPSSNQVSEDPDLTTTDSYYSHYKPKRQWPPDMSKLSPKHQFRLERKYRRRAALKYARPKWTKATILMQWGVIGFVVIYAVFFMEWDTKNGKNPFEGLRNQVFSGLGSIFSTPTPPRPKHAVKPSEGPE